MTPKYSIVIGTYNHLEDCLKPCVESILEYTTLNDFSTELIIVANGCVDGTVEYIRSLQPKFHNIRLLEFPDALGFTRAYNEGIRVARGEYVILFNNDNILLNQPYNKWLELLVEPFEHDPMTGISGPMKEHCPHADRDFILFFCSMVRRSVFEKIGYLDEIFSPGYGEDTDFNARLEDAGYKIVQVPDDSRQFYETNRRTGMFPLYHAGNKTFANWPGGEQLLAKNNGILKERYGKNAVIEKWTKEAEDRGIVVEDYYKLDIEQAKKCDGFMSDEELMWLAKQASKSKVFIEVGSWHGKSSRAIGDNLPEDGKLYCVDHWAGSAVERNTNHHSASWNDGDHAFMEFCDNMVDLIQAGKVVPIRMSSKNASAFFQKHGIKADTVFIDAGHTYEEVKEDIDLWIPVVGDKGVLCGHDYNYTDGMWAGVTKAVNEAFPYATQEDGTNIWSVVRATPIEEQLAAFTDLNLIAATAVMPEEPKVVNNKINIYDCFPFFNELEILDIRFAEMYDVVDRFVIVEATLTHGGKPKPLYFDENKERYAKYLHKVTHLVVEDYPALDSWSIERHQRDQIMRGLTECKDDDMIVISDADEIPRASKVWEFKHDKGIMAFEQKLYYYNFNCQASDPWLEAKIASYREVKDKKPCGVRYWPKDPSTIIKDGGWHFSYFGDTQKIIQKIEATAHQEYNNAEMKDADRIEKVVNERKDLYGRNLDYNFVAIDNSYPKYVLDHLAEYHKSGLWTDFPEEEVHESELIY